MTNKQIDVITRVETVVPDNRVISEEAIAYGVRQERNEKLRTEVDLIASNALRWSELDAPTQALWATYRQALLDVPQQEGFPHTHTFPEEP